MMTAVIVPSPLPPPLTIISCDVVECAVAVRVARTTVMFIDCCFGGVLSFGGGVFNGFCVTTGVIVVADFAQPGMARYALSGCCTQCVGARQASTALRQAQRATSVIAFETQSRFVTPHAAAAESSHGRVDTAAVVAATAGVVLCAYVYDSSNTHSGAPLPSLQRRW